MKGLDTKQDAIPEANPLEGAHSELLLHLSRRELHVDHLTSHPHFEIAAWLHLKNIQQLPSMLVIEYVSDDEKHWQIVDTSRQHSSEGSILLSGVIDLHVEQLDELDIYFCHPSSAVVCEVEELLMNNKEMRLTDQEFYNVA